MGGLTRRVSIQRLADRSGKAYAGNKPFVVKWTVDAHPKSRAWATERAGDRFRAELLTAVGKDEWFDIDSGLPQSMLPKNEEAAETGPNFAQHAAAHVKKKWATWKGNSRKSAVEALVIATTSLTVKPLPSEMLGQMRHYLGGVLLNPAWNVGELSRPSQRCATWLEAHSLPVADLKARHVEDALSAMATRLDGRGPVASNVLTRRRNVLNHCLRMAARDELIVANPVPLVDRSTVSPTRTVDPAGVPELAEALALIVAVAAVSERAARYRSFFEAQLWAGLRPSEASGLVDTQVKLPDEGWGLVLVHGGTVSPGRHWTDSNEAWEEEGQKWRDENAPPRPVPLPPPGVAAFRRHIETYGVGRDGRIFTNRLGHPLTPSNTGKAWRIARSQLWPARTSETGQVLPRRYQPHPLFDVTPYALRHVNASMMIKAGVAPAEAARRLGHSLDVLMRLYARWFDSDELEGNALMDAFLLEQVHW